jgi:hypothetical protein
VPSPDAASRDIAIVGLHPYNHGVSPRALAFAFLAWTFVGCDPSVRVDALGGDAGCGPVTFDCPTPPPYHSTYPATCQGGGWTCKPYTYNFGCPQGKCVPASLCQGEDLTSQDYVCSDTTLICCFVDPVATDAGAKAPDAADAEPSDGPVDDAQGAATVDATIASDGSSGD